MKEKIIQIINVKNDDSDSYLAVLTDMGNIYSYYAGWNSETKREEPLQWHQHELPESCI